MHVHWFHEFFSRNGITVSHRQWKKDDFSLTEKKKIIREIYSVAITNFLPKKYKGEFLQFSQFSLLGNYRNLLPHFFAETFVKVTFLLNKTLMSWFDEICLSGNKFFIFLLCGTVSVQLVMISNSFTYDFMQKFRQINF